MAASEVILSYQFPLTEKPVTLPSNKETYQDVFNLLNSFRLLLEIVVEDAPADGKNYVRRDRKWVELI